MSESPSPFKAGDAVVPLAPLSRQCGAIAGAISVGIVLGRGNASWWLIALGVVVGLMVGLLAGKALGHALTPASAPGQVLVVLAGRTALPLTLRAALIPAALVGLGLSAATAFAFGTPMWPDALLAGLSTAVAVGLIFGLGSALL